MSRSDHVKTSKRLSYVLRHNPASVEVELDPSGWVDLDVLVKQLKRVGGMEVTKEQIVEVVETNDKKRFELIDGRIRAAQGHSVEIELGLASSVPPPVLWHGTVAKFIDSIFENGLIAGARTHVHLSADVETAQAVGSRRGRPVVLQIDANAMGCGGHEFFRSANGVWLTAHVPASAITIAR